MNRTLAKILHESTNSKTIFCSHGSKIHPDMKHLFVYRFLAFLLILITTSWSMMAQDGRGIKNEIENTASWTRPNSARKYLNPNISESVRKVNPVSYTHLTLPTNREV